MQPVSIAVLSAAFVAVSAYRGRVGNGLLKVFLQEEAEHACSLPALASKRGRGESDDEFDFADDKSEYCQLRAIELRDITTEAFGEFEFRASIECDRDAGRERQDGEHYVRACQAFSALKSMCAMETAPIEGDSCVASLLQTSYHDRVDADLKALSTLSLSDVLSHPDALSSCALFVVNSRAEFNVRYWRLRSKPTHADEESLVLDLASFPAGSRWIHAAVQLEQLVADGHVVTDMHPKNWHESDLPRIRVYYI